MQKNKSTQKPSEYLLSIGEASEFTGVSIDTLRRWEKRGKITSLRSPGGHRYFKKEDLINVFGTKYQRDKIASNQTQYVNQEIENTTVKENVLPEKSKETIAKDYYKDMLNVPRFIKGERTSKFEKLFGTTSSPSTPSYENTSTSSNILSTPAISILESEIKEETKNAPMIEKDVKLKWILVVVTFLILLFGTLLILLMFGKQQLISPLP